jgi:hypothetical protein
MLVAIVVDEGHDGHCVGVFGHHPAKPAIPPLQH